MLPDTATEVTAFDLHVSRLERPQRLPLGELKTMPDAKPMCVSITPATFKPALVLHGQEPTPNASQFQVCSE
jgi:hypothetical protein